MDVFVEGMQQGLKLLVAGDAEVWRAVWISVRVALISTCIASVLGLPLGFLVATRRFVGKRAVVVLLNTLMGLPTVVVGLLVYGMLSRRGPLGPRAGGQHRRSDLRRAARRQPPALDRRLERARRPHRAVRDRVHHLE